MTIWLNPNDSLELPNLCLHSYLINSTLFEQHFRRDVANETLSAIVPCLRLKKNNASPARIEPWTARSTGQRLTS